jgi:hypothetical protein
LAGLTLERDINVETLSYTNSVLFNLPREWIESAVVVPVDGNIHDLVGVIKNALSPY